MAAKTNAAAVAKKGANPRAANKAKAQPRGLQMSAAQFKAYNKAFSATAQKLQQAATLKAFATGLRKYRLQAANATLKKYAIARGNAQAASVAAHAALMSRKQSILAHQNAALQQRIGQNAFRHTTLLGRAQFAQAGEKKWAHRAVMRTLTQRQAVSIEAKFLNKVVKNARKTGKKAARATGTPLSKAIAARAKAAGTAAASRVPKSQRAAAASRKYNARAAAASAKATPKAAKTRTAPRRAPAVSTPEAIAAAHAAHFTGYSGPDTQLKPKISRQEWIGDEETPNCVVMAVVNSLLHEKGIRATEKDLEELTELAGEAPVIEEVLWQVYLTGWPGHHAHLADYKAASSDKIEEPDLVIGFSVLTDDGWRDHCALSLPDKKVVSWGAEVDRETPVEEAWELTWRV